MINIPKFNDHKSQFKIGLFISMKKASTNLALSQHFANVNLTVPVKLWKMSSIYFQLEQKELFFNVLHLNIFIVLWFE